MRKKVLSILGAMALCVTAVHAQSDTPIDLGNIKSGWGWNCTFSYDTLNPDKAAGLGCTLDKVSKVTSNGGASFAIKNDALPTTVSDWTKYDKIELLVYSTQTVSFGSSVGYKGWVNSANVTATSEAAVTATALVANEWQIVTIDITKKIVDDASSTINYTSLGDAALNLNTIQLTVSGTTELCIGAITVKAKSSILPTGISLSPNAITLIPGKSLSLALAVEPANALKDVTYTSDKNTIATVDAGIVTTVAPGVAVITATSTAANTVSGTTTVTVVEPASADSKVYATFEKNDPFNEKWGEATATTKENPTKGIAGSGNASDSVMQVTMAQWEAFVSPYVDVNKLTKISWLVYSETAITGFSFKVGINNGINGTVTADIPAKTWTKMEWVISKYNVAEDKFYMQLASADAVTFFIDQIELVAGEVVVPVKSSDATLASLVANVGDLTPAFSPAITEYIVSLPAGMTTVPMMAGIKNDSKATVVETVAASLSETGKIVVTAEDGTKKTYTITFKVAATVGTEINGADAVVVYPNPVSDVLNVTAKDVTLLEIIDADGIVIKSIANQASIAISDLAKGSYTVRVTSSNGTITTAKVVK